MNMNAPALDGRNGRKWLHLALVLFAVFTLALTVITPRVVADMATTATAIDDERASHAVSSAISCISGKMASVINNYQSWTNSYDAVTAPDAASWLRDNWGKASANHDLYDGIAVLDEHGTAIAAFDKGRPFDPSVAFGPDLTVAVGRALANWKNPTVAFMKRKGETVIAGLQPMRPADATTLPPVRRILLSYRKITPDMLRAVSQEYGLKGLSIADLPVAREFSAPLLDANGGRVGYFVWKCEDPGALLLRSEKNAILLGLVVLLAFIAATGYAAFREMRHMKRTADAYWHMATHDALCGLMNRSGFFHALEEGYAGSGVTLILLDLDGFKAVNDTWGHAVGDRLIQVVADAIGRCHVDIAQAARFGGDEFAISVRRGDSVPAVIEAVLTCFRTPWHIDGHTTEIGVSMGLATEEAGIGPTELLRRADLALYHAKETGKGQAVVFTRDLHEAKSHEAELELELRTALRSGDVFPVFQPLFNAGSRRITGVEALARWSYRSGSVPPDVFIPLAERCGLIDALGAHLMEQSILHATRWPNLTLAVNISPLQLCNPAFAAQVEDLLARTGFDPCRLTLEVTEGVLIPNPEQARRCIATLKRIGVRFALDDFGSGYASIGVLRQFGFDRIKIDRSLVTAAEIDRGGLEVMKATVQLARALDLPVTAEGIENANQARLLSEAGCDQLQGYLLARPMTAAKIDLRQQTENDGGDLPIAI